VWINFGRCCTSSRSAASHKNCAVAENTGGDAASDGQPFKSSELRIFRTLCNARVPELNRRYPVVQIRESVALPLSLDISASGHSDERHQTVSYRVQAPTCKIQAGITAGRPDASRSASIARSMTDCVCSPPARRLRHGAGTRYADDVVVAGYGQRSNCRAQRCSAMRRVRRRTTRSGQKTGWYSSPRRQCEVLIRAGLQMTRGEHMSRSSAGVNFWGIRWNMINWTETSDGAASSIPQ
jgi:hypothetical protein